jgi:hypothetical protein
MDQTSWPTDADGDVLRRLASAGFDFGVEHDIDFNVDLDQWPPSPSCLSWLSAQFDNVYQHDPSDDFPGYIRVVVRARVTYQLVTETQRQISGALSKYGAVCESWGVLHGSAA